MPEYTPQYDPWEDLPSEDTPLNAASLNGIETGLVKASIVIVTALPVSPEHGDEVYYEVESGLLWHLVYDSTIVDDYKWVADGAQPLRNAVDTQETITGNLYVNLATAGPLVDAPLDGLYEAMGKATMHALNNSALYSPALGLGLNDYASGAEDDRADSTLVQATNSRVTATVMAEIEAAAGDDIKLRYGNFTSNNTAASQRRLSVRPLRVI